MLVLAKVQLRRGRDFELRRVSEPLFQLGAMCTG